MTSVAGLEISTFRIPLDVEGSMLVNQQCGYFHVWRFLNADGTQSLDGEVRATFGGQWDSEAVPFGYNSKVQLIVPVDRVLLKWDAQPGRIAEILMTRDARGIDASNAPARQIIRFDQGNALSTIGVTVNAVTHVQIRAAYEQRLRLVIQCPETNTAPVYVGSGNASSLRTHGQIINPGGSFVITNYSGAVNGLSMAGNQAVRTMEERNV